MPNSVCDVGHEETDDSTNCDHGASHGDNHKNNVGHLFGGQEHGFVEDTKIPSIHEYLN